MEFVVKSAGDIGQGRMRSTENFNVYGGEKRLANCHKSGGIRLERVVFFNFYYNDNYNRLL